MSSAAKDIQTTEISEFQNELDRKDLIIKNLQNQLSILKSNNLYSNQNQNFYPDLKSKDREIQILNEKILELTADLKEVNAKLNCYELKENFNKNESGNLLEISEMKISQITQEKKIMEEKINQLIEIIKQYCDELNDSAIKIKNLNDDVLFLQNENRKLIEEKENNKKNMNEFNNNYGKYNQIMIENNNNKNIIQNLNKEILEYKMDYNNEINKNKILNEKILNLVNKCNNYEKIQKTFQDANKDLLLAKKQINEINIRNQENENFINTLYSDINDNISLIVDYLNKSINLHQKNENFNQNFDENDAHDLLKNMKKIDEINFEKILDTIDIKKKEILDFCDVLSNGLNASDNENKILAEENDKLKEEINEIIFENKKLNSENIKLNNIINNINNEMMNNKRSTEILKQQLNTINFEKEEMNNKFITELNENKNIFEQLKEDNANLILMSNNLKEEIQILKNKEFENDQTNNNLKLNCQILEKKIKGMQTELELKNIQIQNQEEIINRRNDNNNSALFENDSAIIKKLKADRDNLINDNVLLINQNNLLRQKLNEYDAGKSQSNNNEYDMPMGNNNIGDEINENNY